MPALTSGTEIGSKDELITALAAGHEVDYLFFWGHTTKDDACIGKECLSQWYPVSFEIEGINYPTAEHYMMTEKARLFNDYETLEKILESPQPDAAKKLGRQVKGYCESTWIKQRFNIVVRGNQAKFMQNKKLGEFLLQTNDQVLVEASPHDRIWGIGLRENQAEAVNPAWWKGLNLLGFALMQVRKNLSQPGESGR